MSHSIRTFAKWGAATILAGACAMAAHGQDETGTAAALDSFNFPENITILSQTELSLRRPTATVNGTVITGTDVDQRVALLLAANDVSRIPDDELHRLRLQVLRGLIDETLQIQEAEAQKMPVSADEVAESYGRVGNSQFNRTPEQMDQYLRSIGSSPHSLKRQIEGELAWDRLMRRNVAPFVNVSAEEVNEIYERMQASRGTNEYRIAEIFLSSNPTNRTAIATEAQRIVDELRKGADFADYARLRSESSTAARGGDLGWIKLEQLQNAQLEEVAAQLQPGQMVGPIEIPGGFDIIFMIDRRQIGMADPRDALLSLKQISLEFPAGTSTEDARARANSFAEAVKQIRGCGEADGVAATLGAQVVNNDQIAVRALPDALQGALLELNVGQATPAFGSLDEGVRVLMVCGRDDPNPEAGPDRDALASSLEDDRVGKRAQRYLRDLRRDAVIDYN